MRRKDGEEARKGLCLTCLLGRASEAAMAQRIEDSHLSAQEKALLTHLRALDPARSATIAPPLSASERLAAFPDPGDTSLRRMDHASRLDRQLGSLPLHPAEPGTCDSGSLRRADHHDEPDAAGRDRFGTTP